VCVCVCVDFFSFFIQQASNQLDCLISK